MGSFSQFKMVRAAWAVLFVALCARVIVLLALVIPEGQSAVLFGDSIRYLTLADSVLAGNGYMYDGVLETFRAPGYPAFFMILRILHLPLIAGSVFQIVLASGIAVWAMWFARTKLFLSETASLLVGMIAALEPVQVYYSVILLPDVFFAWGFLISFMFALAWLEHGRLRDVVVAGLAIGIGNYMRPAMLYLPVVYAVAFIGYAFVRSRSLRRAIIASSLLSAVAFAVLFPWYMRNVSEFGAFGFISVKEYTLFFSGASAVEAAARNVPFETVKQEFLQRARNEAPDPAFYTFANAPYFSSEARKVMYAHPAELAKLSSLGVITFWTAGNYQYVFKDLGLLAPPSRSISYSLMLSTEGFMPTAHLFLSRISEPFILTALFDRVLWSVIFLASFVALYLKRADPLAWLLLLVFAYFSVTILTTLVGVEARHRYALNPILFGLTVMTLHAAYLGISRRIKGV